MLDELEWPSLEAHRDRSSLLLFHKIHSGAVSAVSYVYGVFCTCVIFQTKSKININQLGINIAIKLLLIELGVDLSFD